jgi:hypothetical protein
MCLDHLEDLKLFVVMDEAIAKVKQMFEILPIDYLTSQ